MRETTNTLWWVMGFITFIVGFVLFWIFNNENGMPIMFMGGIQMIIIDYINYRRIRRTKEDGRKEIYSN
jgi:ABC-type iron transport system FetAB permease component